jgi:hypothetical protein
MPGSSAAPPSRATATPDDTARPTSVTPHRVAHHTPEERTMDKPMTSNGFVRIVKIEPDEWPVPLYQLQECNNAGEWETRITLNYEEAQEIFIHVERMDAED